MESVEPSLAPNLPPRPITPNEREERLDVPGVILDDLLIGSSKNASDRKVLKHLRVGYILDVENAMKRVNQPLARVNEIDSDRVELDDDGSLDSFRTSISRANQLIDQAREDGKIVFVYCTHGNNESAIVCMAYLMLSVKWTLERAYKHVLQKRSSSAPRRAFTEQLRKLEHEVYGRVTLRSTHVGPSMMDIMMGLRGETPVGRQGSDVEDTWSQVTEAESFESAQERASMITNFSVTTGLHNGSSLRETTIIAERDEEFEVFEVVPHPPLRPMKRGHKSKGSCIIS